MSSVLCSGWDSCWPAPGDLIQTLLTPLFRDTDWTIKPLIHASDCGGNWSTGTKNPAQTLGGGLAHMYAENQAAEPTTLLLQFVNSCDHCQ